MEDLDGTESWADGGIAELSDDLHGSFLSRLLRQVGSVMDEMQEREKMRERHTGISSTGLSAPQIRGTATTTT